MPTGNLVLPAVGDVRLGVGYGANGTELVGTAIFFTDPAVTGGVSAAGRNDLIANAIVAALQVVMPKEWNIYARRDLRQLPGDLYPRVYVDAQPTRVLEVETDNQILVGYGEAVVLLVNEAAIQRTDSDLTSLRRMAEQAVYTTLFPSITAAGLTVEDIQIDDGCPAPNVSDEKVSWLGFTVTVGILESREVAHT